MFDQFAAGDVRPGPYIYGDDECHRLLMSFLRKVKGKWEKYSAVIKDMVNGFKIQTTICDSKAFFWPNRAEKVTVSPTGQWWVKGAAGNINAWGGVDVDQGERAHNQCLLDIISETFSNIVANPPCFSAPKPAETRDRPDEAASMLQQQRQLCCLKCAVNAAVTALKIETGDDETPADKIASQMVEAAQQRTKKARDGLETITNDIHNGLNYLETRVYESADNQADLEWIEFQKDAAKTGASINLGTKIASAAVAIAAPVVGTMLAGGGIGAMKKLPWQKMMTNAATIEQGIRKPDVRSLVSAVQSTNESMLIMDSLRADVTKQQKAREQQGRMAALQIAFQEKGYDRGAAAVAAAEVDKKITEAENKLEKQNALIKQADDWLKKNRKNKEKRKEGLFYHSAFPPPVKAAFSKWFKDKEDWDKKKPLDAAKKKKLKDAYEKGDLIFEWLKEQKDEEAHQQQQVKAIKNPENIAEQVAPKETATGEETAADAKAAVEVVVNKLKKQPMCDISGTYVENICLKKAAQGGKYSAGSDLKKAQNVDVNARDGSWQGTEKTVADLKAAVAVGGVDEKDKFIISKCKADGIMAAAKCKKEADDAAKDAAAIADAASTAPSVEASVAPASTTAASAASAASAANEQGGGRKRSRRRRKKRRRPTRERRKKKRHNTRKRGGTLKHRRRKRNTRRKD